MRAWKLFGLPALSSHARSSRPTVFTVSVLPFHFATEWPYHAGPRFSRFSPDGSARPSVHSMRMRCSDWNSCRMRLGVMMNSIGSVFLNRLAETHGGAADPGVGRRHGRTPAH